MTQKKHFDITETQSCKTGVKRFTGYKGYNIEPDLTGYAPKDSTYYFYIDSEKVDGSGESIEDCKKQIDELIKDVHSICTQTTS